MPVSSGDVVLSHLDTQVVHSPLNTGVDGYAHAMHSFMNKCALTGTQQRLRSSRPVEQGVVSVL